MNHSPESKDIALWCEGQFVGRITDVQSTHDFRSHVAQPVRRDVHVVSASDRRTKNDKEKNNSCASEGNSSSTTTYLASLQKLTKLKRAKSAITAL